jgi:predicted RNA-binding Zn ribbon-like protein
VTFSFLAGNLALDFVASVASRGTVAEEKLPDAEALARWITASHAVDESPDVSAAEFRVAIELREAIYRAVRARAAGQKAAAADIAQINAAAAYPTPIPSFADGIVVKRGTIDAVLALIARAAQDALADDRLRACEGRECTRLFIDSSRAHTRRWCGMAGCGDRAKAATYRRHHARVRMSE